MTGKEVHEIISELSEIENNLFLGLQSPDTEKEITETKDMFWENLQETEFEVDFVVHPSESGLDHIPRNIFVEILKKRRNPNSFQILRLPRVMMNHEWSVPFFANYFGNTFEGKTVLIIDDASSSGETLLKVIDSVCYLNAKKIIVLSFISRMNDFQSEFLSRIRKISNNHLDINHSSIPIDIYFGAHLNIPSYSANSEDCPHCKGYRLYEKQLKIKDLPDAVKSHLKKGLQILKPVKYREISLIGDAYIIEYLPKSLDVKKMYIYRDFLGKIMHQETSNKSYDVDGINYKNPIKEYSAEDLEIYLSILLHEPNFIPILRKHLPPLYYSLIIYFNSCSVSSTRLSPILKNVEPRLLSHWSEFRRFHYKWRMDSIVFLMNELDPQFYFLENSNFFLVLNLVEQNKHALDQVMYKLWAIFEENPNKRDFLVTYLVK